MGKKGFRVVTTGRKVYRLSNKHTIFDKTGPVLSCAKDLKAQCLIEPIIPKF